MSKAGNEEFVGVSRIFLVLSGTFCFVCFWLWKKDFLLLQMLIACAGLKMSSCGVRRSPVDLWFQ